MLTKVVPTTDVKDGEFDAVVVVTDKVENLTGHLACLQKVLKQHQQVNWFK